jgi:Nucleoside diphosphate kinase
LFNLKKSREKNSAGFFLCFTKVCRKKEICAKIVASFIFQKNGTNFSLIKPDAIQRGLVGEVTRRLERKGLKLIGVKMMRLDSQILREHYSHLADKPFFWRGRRVYEIVADHRASLGRKSRGRGGAIDLRHHK